MKEEDFLNDEEFLKANKEKSKILKAIIKEEKKFLDGDVQRHPDKYSKNNECSPWNQNKKYKDQYFEKIQYNLWDGYDEKATNQYPHFSEYSKGDGGELEDTPNKKGEKIPAKMKSICSSSAMTYNILGNKSLQLIKKMKFSDDMNSIPRGIFTVEYEKQMPTLINNRFPANLDAFLYNKQSKAAIFCEMKMTEWIRDNPSELREGYKKEKRYFSNYSVFNKIIENIKQDMHQEQKNENANLFRKYNAWQMFKHILGIYNMTILDENIRKRVLAVKGIERLPDIKKAILVNVEFEPSDKVFDDNLNTEYQKLKNLEYAEFDLFKKALNKSGIMEDFKQKCGIDFDVQLMSAEKFMNAFDRGGEVMKYLGRYRI